MKEKRKIAQLLISVMGLFLFLLGWCLPAGGEDMIWRPRTPAGGASTIDPDYYFRMADAAKDGSGNTQQTQTFDGRLLGRGFYEVTDDGQVIYYDLMGNTMDVSHLGAVEDDPDNPPNGVVYYSVPRQVVTY